MKHWCIFNSYMFFLLESISVSFETTTYLFFVSNYNVNSQKHAFDINSNCKNNAHYFSVLIYCKTKLTEYKRQCWRFWRFQRKTQKHHGRHVRCGTTKHNISIIRIQYSNSRHNKIQLHLFLARNKSDLGQQSAIREESERANNAEHRKQLKLLSVKLWRRSMETKHLICKRGIYVSSVR